jgi:hypothetical protein
MDSEEIKKTIIEIRDSDLDENKLRKKYAKFVDECPRLFEFVMDKNIDLAYLQPMFEQLELIKTEKIDLNTADSNVYSILRKDFIPEQYQ